MTQEDKVFLLKDLCARIPYGVICHYNCAIRCDTMEINKSNCVGKLEGIIPFNGHIGFMVGGDKVNALFHDIKPYLRPMSSMTKEEKRELLCTIVGKDAVKYFQVLSDGSIDNTDAEHQDLHNFTMHWINFDGSNTTSYIDWLNAHHFDYRGLIPKGLAIEVTKENNPYENNN